MESSLSIEFAIFKKEKKRYESVLSKLAFESKTRTLFQWYSKFVYKDLLNLNLAININISIVRLSLS